MSVAAAGSSKGVGSQRNTLFSFLRSPPNNTSSSSSSSSSAGNCAKRPSLPQKRLRGLEKDDDSNAVRTCPLCQRVLWRDEALTNMHIDACLLKQQHIQVSKDMMTDGKTENTLAYVPQPLLKQYDIRAVDHPAGLWLIYDFITEEEEMHIIRSLDSDHSTPWKHSSFNGHCLSKVYGVRTQFGLPNEPRLVRENDVKLGEYGIPAFLEPYPNRLLDIVAQRKDMPVDLRNFIPNECNANHYQKSLKHYLKPHYDDRALSGPVLMNLSLAGRSRMTYTKPGTTEMAVVDLPPRCLQLVTGSARWDFMHSIKAEDVLDERRMSITWRHSGAKRTGIQPLASQHHKSDITSHAIKLCKSESMISSVDQQKENEKNEVIIDLIDD